METEAELDYREQASSFLDAVKAIIEDDGELVSKITESDNDVDKKLVSIMMGSDDKGKLENYLIRFDEAIDSVHHGATRWGGNVAAPSSLLPGSDPLKKYAAFRSVFF